MHGLQGHRPSCPADKSTARPECPAAAAGRTWQRNMEETWVGRPSFMRFSANFFSFLPSSCTRRAGGVGISVVRILLQVWRSWVQVGQLQDSHHCVSNPWHR